jgi:membrane protease YdiL (CAAX protease family)
MPHPDWRARADETFLAGMPARGRVAVEMLFLLALVFAANAFVVSTVTAAIVVGCELLLALALVRPWARVHGSILARVLVGFVVLLAVVAPAAIERPDIGSSRRLGVGIVAGTTSSGDPAVAGGVVLVTSVQPGTPADGVLRTGDRIVALGGAPLDRDDAPSSLARRTHGDELPEDTTVTVLRGHEERVLRVHVPKVRGARERFGRRIAAVRELSARHLVVAAAIRGALIIALLLVLVRADGQTPATLGLVKKGALRELAAATWMTAGAFVVQLVVAIPIGLIGLAAGVLEHENQQRTQSLGLIARQSGVLEFALAAIVATAFEEIAFRGFLLPRARKLVGSWPVAVVIVSVIFGAGHLYEGPLATIQTAFLGAYFAAMMLARRRLVGPMAAHAAFDTIMIVVVRLVMTGHVLERLKALAPH